MESNSTVHAQVINLPHFWDQVSESEYTLLALDYDGTLAPFHIDPMKAHPLPGIPPLLKGLSKSRNTTVVIISGRPVEDLCALLGSIGITLIGCHGFEVIDADGNLTVRGPDREQLEAMEKASTAAVCLGLGGRLEVKTASVAVHTRGMSQEEASKVEGLILQEWLGIKTSGTGCRRFNGGVELYCNGWNKGDALGVLLKNMPRGTLPVYVGDDATDEDVFRYLRGSGIGIKVGSPGSATEARGFLPNCHAVREFLCSWLARIDLERSSAHNGNEKTCSGFKSPANSP